MFHHEAHYEGKKTREKVSCSYRALDHSFSIVEAIPTYKTWQYGHRLSFFIGIGLLLFAMLAFIDPGLLSSLSLTIP